MKKCLVTLLLILLTLPILSSCWNQKELTDLAFVTAMGIDKGKNKKFDVSFQIVIPGNVSSAQGVGGQGLPIGVYKSSGDTLTEAARNATKNVSRRLYYAHTNLLVINEKVAKSSDMLNIFDALERDPEFRTTTVIVISRKSSAEDIVTALTILDKIPVNKITKELKTTESMLGENMVVNIDDFLNGVLSKGKQPAISGYSLSGKKSEARKSDNLQKTTTDAVLEASGIAIFNGGKLKGWIDNKKARGVVWILDKVKSTNISIMWNKKKNALSFVTIRTKTNVSASTKNGKPSIQVAIEDEGWIDEANTAIDLTDPSVIGKIDKLVEKEIKKEILATVNSAKRFKSDIFGFGEKVHRADPKLWKKIKGNWNEQFADLEVNVKVNSYIRREGVRTKPFWSDINK